MSLEDKIHSNGHGDAFSAAYEAFTNSNMSREKQHVFYDELCSWGASSEEADEFINSILGAYE